MSLRARIGDPALVFRTWAQFKGSALAGVTTLARALPRLKRKTPRTVLREAAPETGTYD